MDQQTAQHLFDVGAMLVLLDVPSGTEIGIDMHSWQTAHNFKGIKMIPPGLHFIYFNVRHKAGDSQMSPTSSFFRFFNEKEVVVRRWIPDMETFAGEVNEEELQRFTENKKELDKFCGPYPYESYKKWVSLSRHMTSQLVCRIQPSSGFIYSASALVSECSDTSSRSSKPKVDVPLEKMTADNLMPDMKPCERDLMNYTSVRRFPAGCTPDIVTKCALDSSMIMQDFIHQCGSWQNLIGELQMAFVCFLIGQQYDSFDQWKKIVAMLCGNQSSIAEHSELYTELISVLHFQMKEVPEDFFVDIVSNDNFLTFTLHNLFTNIAESAASAELKSLAKRFSDHLTKKFGWCFEDEPDDCAPVVVDEHGNY